MQFSKLIIYLVLLVLMACQEQKENSFSFWEATHVEPVQVQADALILRPGEGLVYFNDRPFSGSSLSYYNNGNLACQIDFLNGKKHGLYKKWFEDGQLSYESQYVTGKQDGIAYTWWRNGNKRSASTFTKGVPYGKQQQWYRSGAKFKKINLVNGKEEGLQQSWRENGKLYNNYEAKNGRIFGLKKSNLCYELNDEKIKLQED